MPMVIVSRHLDGIVVLRSETIADHRGSFMEVFRKDQFLKLGLEGDFVQDNQSRSIKGVLRGLHFQWNPSMGKLMRATVGSIFLVAVDIRKGSPTLGEWFGIGLVAEERNQVWTPPGFATGYCVLSEHAEVQYKCTAVYNPMGESGLRWDDPALAIGWPIRNPILSVRDANARTLSEWLKDPASDSFIYADPLGGAAHG